jgi:S1-C subfamily serine protease
MRPRFIIPAIAAAVWLTLLANAAQARPFMGIQYKLNSDGKGMLIMEVQGDSPAEKAGLKAKDVILKINGTEPTSLQEFREIIGLLKVGDTVTLEIRRDDKEEKVKVTLGEMKG